MQELADREAIRELKSRYHRLVDTGDSGGLWELFTAYRKVDGDWKIARLHQSSLHIDGLPAELLPELAAGTA